MATNDSKSEEVIQQLGEEIESINVDSQDIASLCVPRITTFPTRAPLSETKYKRISNTISFQCVHAQTTQMDKSAMMVIVHMDNTNREEIFEKGKDEPTERARVTEGEIKSKSLETAIAAEDF